MRTLSGPLQTAQASLNRKPNTKLILRDVMLRFYNHSTSGYNTNYPATTKSGLPWCPIDMDINASDGVYRVWCDVSNWSYHARVDPTSDWSGGYSQGYAYPNGGIDYPHRISVEDNIWFHSNGSNIRWSQVTSNGSHIGGIWRTSAHSTTSDRVALAAVNANVVYMLTLHTSVDSQYLKLTRFEDVNTDGDADDPEDTTEVCPHTIVVDSGYDTPSLTWFDAATIGNRDVVIVNEKAYGHPVMIFYEDGVWSEPRPIMPMDIVDQYSFLRISHVSKIVDGGSEQVLWATGRMGFKGSTGTYVQEYDVALRSKDGEHWSMDRYAYVCSMQVRGKFMVNPSSVFYPEGATIKRARRTWRLGYDHTDLKLTLTDDILGWSFSQNPAGSPAVGQTAIADHDGQHAPDTYDTTARRWETKDDALAIHPGMCVWRYVGYSGEEVLLAMEAVDKLPPQFRSGNRQLSMATRDWTMRMLTDWASVQDWQWLSEQKHYDDCDKIDHIYSVGAASIEVKDYMDAELTGHIEETELSISGGLGGDPTYLVFEAVNREGVFLTTSPFETRNCTVRAHFKYTHGHTDDTPKGLSHNLQVDTNQGSLAYGDDGSKYFTDSGQIFSPWATWSSSEIPAYIIVVTNTDSTITWAYLGQLQDTTNKDDVYVYTAPDKATSGWNGAGDTGKTPSSYYIARADECTRIGTGFGVIGCAVDQYNFVAAWFNLVEGANQNTLYLLARHGDEDANQWFVLNSSAIDDTLSKGHLYEVELQRNGGKLTARLVRYVYSGTAVTRSQRGSVSYTWGMPFRMIETADDDDMGKTGVLIHQAVAETEIYQCGSKQDTVLINPEIFDRPFTYTYDSHVYKAYYTNKFDPSEWDVDSLGVAPLYFGGEVWRAEDMDFTTDSHYYTVLKLTDSKMRTPCLYVDWHNWATRQMGGGVCAWENAYGSYRPDGIPGGDFGNQEPWGMLVTRDAAKGVHSSCVDCTSDNGGFFGIPQPFYDDEGEDVYYIGFMTTEEWAMIELNEEPTGNREDRFIATPGFFLSGRKGWEGAMGHSTGTKIRQHWKPKIHLHGVWAYDHEFDKHRDWVLRDIAAKAGVLDCETRKSVNQASMSLPQLETTTGPTWLSDKYKNVDLTMILPSKLGNSQRVCVIFRSNNSEQLFSSGTWSIAATNAVYGFYGKDASGHPVVGFRQTCTEGDNNNTWIAVEDETLDDSMDGKRIRFVLLDNFLTIYVNDARCRTMRFGPIFGVDEDGYSENCEKPGFVGFFASGGSPTVSVTQPEMFAWTDGVILDQRMNAVSGMKRVIRNQRIKFFSRPDGILLMSYFATRDDVGTIDDEIFVDSYGFTDRVPTHIRTSGEEESDYIDHSAAEKYGLLFSLAQVPYLDEAEAYAEAKRIVKDALSESQAHRVTGKALLETEIEDELTINYTPSDGGPAINADFIADRVEFSFNPGDLTMNATLREKQS